MIPYIFVSACWAIPVYIYFYGAAAVWDKFFLGQSPSQLWFLLMLFWVFIIFWPISAFVDQHPIIGGVIVVGFYGFYIISSSIPNLFNLKTGFQYLVFFYIGFIIRKHGSIVLLKIPMIVYFLVHGIVFLFHEHLVESGNILMKLINSGISLLVCIMGALLGFVILQKLLNKLSKPPKVLSYLSIYSMGIYLFHEQVIYFVLAGLLQITWLPSIALVLITFVVGLCVSLLIAAVLSNWKVTRFFIGN